MQSLSQIEELSHRLRERVIDLNAQTVLIAHLGDTDQSSDIKDGPNCKGYGRIRHFKRHNPKNAKDWPPDPLPIDPVSGHLGFPRVDGVRAQVFQLAACNIRCWYCFVSNESLSPATGKATTFSAESLYSLYKQEVSPPNVIDLSGGQPGLVPEWSLWFSRVLQGHDEKRILLWEDDNLTINFMKEYLTGAEIEELISLHNYERVCCFKGFDGESISYNTGCEKKLIDRQFEILEYYYSIGLRPYAYATFTYVDIDEAEVFRRMEMFVGRLKEIDSKLPLRTVPLQIHNYSPVKARSIGSSSKALENQLIAINAWTNILARLYPREERQQFVDLL